MAKFCLIVLTIFTIICASVTVFSTEFKMNNLDLEAIRFAEDISTLKDKYYLEYKSQYDLIETCRYAIKYSNDVFTKEDLITVAIKESRLNKNALNKADGGKGLYQITKPEVWWKEELHWFKKPYSKDQNTKAAITILSKYYEDCGNKEESIRRYNSKGPKGKIYLKAIKRIRRDVLKATA